MNRKLHRFPVLCAMSTAASGSKNATHGVLCGYGNSVKLDSHTRPKALRVEQNCNSVDGRKFNAHLCMRVVSRTLGG